MKHKQKIIYSVVLYVAVICLGLSLHAEQKNPVTDLSETIFRLNGGIFTSFGSWGFGVHDIGEKKIKFLDWNFKVIKAFPIRRGEGPGEIKSGIESACRLDNKNVVIWGFNEFRINIFQPDGTFASCFPTSFLPMKVLAYQDKIYVISSQIEFSDNKNFFLEIFDGKTGKSIKKVKFQEVPDPNAPKVNFSTTTVSICLDEKGLIWIAHGATATLYQVDTDGKILKKIKLPYIDKRDVIKKKNLIAISWKKVYNGLVIKNNSIYTVFSIYSYSEDKKHESRVLKIEMNGNFSEKRLDDGFVLLGKKGNDIFLFQNSEYFARIVKVSELKPQNK